MPRAFSTLTFPNRAQLVALAFLSALSAAAQGRVYGTVTDAGGQPLGWATVLLQPGGLGTLTDSLGHFEIGDVPVGEYRLTASSVGYTPEVRDIGIDVKRRDIAVYPQLGGSAAQLEQVVVSGTLRPVSRSASPVPVEVYTAEFFRANPAPSVFESLQHVNGVRPQLNCAVCNTGDIHINGLEGPYTMVLIDGMPIVSGLSTVYGLTGIPASLIERTEVIKGPASTLYGSEAVGGLINVITTAPASAPRLSAEVTSSNWGDVNADLGLRARAGDRLTGLLGVNYFNYQQPRDDNGDGFTDLTLQDRLSVFSKWALDRPGERVAQLAGRYVREDRWGGQLHYDPERHRGGEDVYGEAIRTRRWEAYGTYQLPTRPRLDLQFSANGHQQRSAYGSTIYDADQHVGFGQLLYRPALGPAHDLLAGLTYRYTRYDDNTPATAAAAETHLPGAFVQDQLALSPASTLLLGLRYDHNSRHGSILTPRLNYMWNSTDYGHVLRLSLGNGYRVANVFTEDHAALSGAREVVFAEELRPERSWNANLNYVRKLYDWGRALVTLDASLWYTRFGNRILPDYETNPNQIIYANLDGRAVSRGGSLNADVSYPSGVRANLGLTLQDVFTTEEGQRRRQLLTEGASAVWTLHLPWKRTGLSLDYTGNLYGPMELPLLGELDDRAPRSPWFSIQNLRLGRRFGRWELYGGVKNLLNFRPPANSIARPFDPFDREVTFDAQGGVVATPANPRALTFDPTYVYASNQGLRGFLGARFTLE